MLEEIPARNCESAFPVYNSTISIFASGLDKVAVLVAAFHGEKPAALNLPAWNKQKMLQRSSNN
jgi:hypothetical protein